MTNEEAIYIRNHAELLISQNEIMDAINRMASEITKRLHSKNPIVISVLNGGLIISGQLLTRLDFPLQVDYIHAGRYGNKMNGEELVWKVKPSLPFTGRTVLLIDDILDEGITLAAIADYCKNQGAKEVLTAVLVEKLHTRKVKPGMRADFGGVETADRFLFGYGLDYKGYWRNAPGIFAVNGT